MAAADKPRWLDAGSLWIYRVLTGFLLAAGLAFAAIVISLRYWILPNIEDYRDDIARIVSARAGQKVTVEKLQANWEGLRPHLKLQNITVYDAAGQPAFRLARMDQTLSWLSLLLLELRFHALEIHGPALHVRRDARGVISLAGVELGREAGESGFADWLLRQRDIIVRDATIIWSDAQRQAPPLELKHVFLQVYSRGGRHRFGLQATPPPELAAPLDVRGDLRGETIQSITDWKGDLFLQLDYADIAAWRAWVPFPVEFPRGTGAVRAWLTLDGSRMAEVIADVRLSNVLARLEKDLPELDLSELAGRIGWKQTAAGFEITTTRLELITTGGLALPPADFMLRHARAAGGRPAHGEMRANALELAPLVALADRLPLGEDARNLLAAYSPKGALYDLAARWSGDWRAPQAFNVRSRFRGLAINRAGTIPGFTGVSGSLESNEEGGTLALNSHEATVDMPLVFRDPLRFEAFTAQTAWTRSGSGTELKLNGISFSNAHLAGTVFGNYRTAGSAHGIIDLTGQLTRADARYVGRYIPLIIGKDARAWLDKAFIAGQSNDVSLRLKGDLDEFPFADGKGGVFQVAARVTGGVLHYADGWPDIADIAGDLLFRGKRMDVRARQGAISGVRLEKVHVEIPDLQQDEQVLNVSGQAAGATRDFLAFIEKSPVAGMTDHFTESWRAQGDGTLSLGLSIPFSAPQKARVTGAYRFAGNTFVISPDLPALEQAAGRVEFTDTSVRMQNVTASLLGGPVTLSATTARDASVRVTLEGRVNPDGVRKAGGPEWVRHLHGSTDWRAVIDARKRNADVVVESSLQG
ncbi:MAG TPA: DUF3971 domain-containing protein, partial [Burkholderiales bacterium]|nr:DUF3971 domain-containing protein [Burkholderiales bacterium]